MFETSSTALLRHYCSNITISLSTQNLAAGKAGTVVTRNVETLFQSFDFVYPFVKLERGCQILATGLQNWWFTQAMLREHEGIGNAFELPGKCWDGIWCCTRNPSKSTLGKKTCCLLSRWSNDKERVRHKLMTVFGWVLPRQGCCIPILPNSLCRGAQLWRSIPTPETQWPRGP